MLKKISKVFIAFIISLNLTSCFRKAMYEFYEGTYQYEGEEINFYNDFVAKNIVFNFTYIEQTEDILTLEQNRIINRKTKGKYSIEIILTDESNKLFNLNFVCSDELPGMPDMYDLIVDLSELTNIDESYMRISLYLHQYDELNAIIHIQINDFYIGEERITDYNFPGYIYIVNHLDE